jgi:hypothetical protein
MMYKNNLTAAIKVKGKVLRENKDEVSLPFGSEYTVAIRNLNSVRALVKVSVDGTDATDGNWLIIPANSSIELERFIRNSNFNSGNRFKFIERTAAVENGPRGIKAEDGLIRIEYKFEIPQTVYATYNPSYTYATYNSDYCGTGWNSVVTTTTGAPIGGSITTPLTPAAAATPTTRVGKGSPLRTRGVVDTGLNKKAQDRSLNFCQQSMSADYANVNNVTTSTNTAGVTVAGSVSNQKFTSGEYFPSEATSHVIVLKLIGEVQGVKFERPVTVQQKRICNVCGKSNKGYNQFCGRCGSSLVLV